MILSSLRGKIFLLVVAVLLSLTTTMMLVTQRDVTATVAAGEQHAIGNVMDLLRRDLDSRWATLLQEKVEIVSGGKQDLRRMGQTLQAMVEAYADLARRGVVGEGAARGLARAWINRMSLDTPHDVYLYDAGLHVLASNRHELIDADLSGLKDIKGHAFAAAMLARDRATSMDYTLFRWPDGGYRGGETRYAYFTQFPPWQWMLVVDDGTQGALQRARWRREQMEQALKETLSRLTLAQSGFVMILDDQGRAIAPAPPRFAGILSSPDQHTGSPLAALLRRQDDAKPLGRVPYANEHGAWLIETSYFAPLKWTLVGAVPEQDLKSPAQRLMQRQAVAFAATLVLALTLAWLLAARLARPLNQLARYALQLAGQDLARPQPVPPEIKALPRRNRDETGRLAASFLHMADRLSRNVRQLLSETAARERFESELNVARDIQLGLLPAPLPDAACRRLDLHALMVPAKEVGGDLYDYFPMRDGQLCVVIGDVSGKGVPAALFMAVTRTLIRTVAEDESDPAMITARVNDRLSQNNPRLMFVTLIVATIDPATRQLRWANAGHPPPLLCVADGDIWPLAGRSGPACGIQAGIPYRGFSARLQPGNLLLTYTDGVTEAMSPESLQYGETRLQACLKAARAQACQPILEAVLADVKAHARAAEQSDDITLVAARIR
jgi:sigma-B regulation protein RsbU (phosphoserine phosphatase)